MASFFELDYIQHFQQLPSSLFSHVQPQGLPHGELILASKSTAELIGLDDLNAQEPHPDVIKLLSGQGLLSNWQPIAMKYTGHQFGHYNPDLGDGRGLLLAQVKSPNNDSHHGNHNEVWDLHLKGAGITPYSRQGDGRAVLRSSIREFLASEAMAAVNIPTTRALSLVHSPMPVYRETQETAAMVMRVAKSHIRFGHFEYCSFTGQHDLLKTLCDHVINMHYPHLMDHENNNPYEAFFAITLDKTAKLIAHWQSIGFNHGVMNTDNMSIIGDTFDYGPFAFLDDYDANFICNHSDHQGRYAFKQQPNIANWNLAVLAQALLPLCEKDNLVNTLDSFSETFINHYLSLMKKKFGLSDSFDKTSSQTLLETTLTLLQNNHLDYTNFFRQLSHIHEPEVFKTIRDNVLDLTEFDHWFNEYKQALTQDGQTFSNQNENTQRAIKMNKVNPKYILRNYLAQNAIADAQAGNYDTLKTLHQVLLKPFDEQSEFEALAQLPPDWGKKLEISCSS